MEVLLQAFSLFSESSRHKGKILQTFSHCHLVYKRMCCKSCSKVFCLKEFPSEIEVNRKFSRSEGMTVLMKLKELNEKTILIVSTNVEVISKEKNIKAIF
ncbi:CLUMA_CG007885, isoform A [Clunio marinus]|uniref:CLUMA_CG007885, isoform A n=1 Tax=Clunio marinus TaxID=568069 RepID=A0A1J1I229_9DIPT|nr:CLUMA_CG007885, isoform A [Clunio marinus]